MTTIDIEAGPEGIVRLRVENEGLTADHIEATVTRLQGPTATTVTIRLNAVERPS